MLSLLRYLGVVYAEKPNTYIYLACVYLACVVGQGRQLNELKNIYSSSCQVVLLGHFEGDDLWIHGRLRYWSLLGDYNRAVFASLNIYFIVNIVVFEWLLFHMLFPQLYRIGE